MELDFQLVLQMAPNNGDTVSQIKKSQYTTNTDLIAIKSSTDILLDLLIVYLFVPLWITLLASLLKYIHETTNYYVFWSNDIDLAIFPIIFISIGIPLTCLRFQASNPSHFLHPYRVETTEKFIQQTRTNPPSLLKPDIAINIILISTMNLSDIFSTKSLQEITYQTMYTQAIFLLFIFDAGTYFGHLMVHRPRWYKYHKSHHNVRNTVAISLIDIDMADFFVNNLPLLILPILYWMIGYKMCYEVWIIGFAYMFAQGFIIHSDLYLISTRYSLGLFWGDTVISHSLHHSRNNGYYSFVSPQIWDWICQTQ